MENGTIETVAPDFTRGSKPREGSFEVFVKRINSSKSPFANITTRWSTEEEERESEKEKKEFEQWMRVITPTYNGGEHDTFICPTCFCSVTGRNWEDSAQNRKKHTEYHLSQEFRELQGRNEA